MIPKWFTNAFNAATVVLPHRWKSDRDMALAKAAYWQTLCELGQEDILEGLRRLRQDGTADGWFPSEAAWFDAAAEAELSRPVRIERALPPAPHVHAEEMAGIEAARARLVQQCRDEGFHDLADMFESLPIRHPSEDTRQLVCDRCFDTGMRDTEDGAVACECVETNVQIRRRRLRGRREHRLSERKRRAEVLAPSRLLGR